jgi:hypothetical protein
VVCGVNNKQQRRRWGILALKTYDPPPRPVLQARLKQTLCQSKALEELLAARRHACELRKTPTKKSSLERRWTRLFDRTNLKKNLENTRCETRVGQPGSCAPQKRPGKRCSLERGWTMLGRALRPQNHFENTRFGTRADQPGSCVRTSKTP